MTVDQYAEQKMTEAVAELEQMIRNHRMWMIAYYDPTLSPEVNENLAFEAVKSGWTPNNFAN
jgi:hypothetical protein